MKGRKVEFILRPTSSNDLWLIRDIVTMGREYKITHGNNLGTHVFVELNNGYSHPVAKKHLNIKPTRLQLFFKRIFKK